jgi:hypothetical protein
MNTFSKQHNQQGIEKCQMWCFIVIGDNKTHAYGVVSEKGN